MTAGDEPPPFNNWQEAWEWHAVKAAESFATQSKAGLLTEIQAGRYDPYYQIYYSLREVRTLATCTPVLLEVLRRRPLPPARLPRRPHPQTARPRPMGSRRRRSAPGSHRQARTAHRPPPPKIKGDSQPAVTFHLNTILSISTNAYGWPLYSSRGIFSTIPTRITFGLLPITSLLAS